MASSTSSLPITWRSEASPEEYERARVGRVFNHRRPSRFPIAVVEPTEEAHVVAAVRLANERKCRVSVRSGGHSWAAWSVRDDAILIDFGNLKEIDYDDKTGIVKVSPSTTGRVLNGYLRERGRMFPGGHCPDVGVGGFLLQGGMGWVCKSWGWACQNVLALDVVAADGSQLHCSATENPDLYWAARGSGPGFPGIVTRFHLQTRPSYSHIRTSAYIYPAADFRKAIGWASSIADDFDPDTEMVVVGSYAPNSYQVESSEITILVLFTTFKQSEEEARKALQPAEDSHPPGTVKQWFCDYTDMTQEYNNQAAANPEGHRYATDNAYIRNDADLGATLEEAFTTLPSTKSFALWYSMSPATKKPLPDMALSLQSDHYFAIYSVWEDAEEDNKCQSWLRNVMSKIERESEGSYLGDADFQIRRTRYWGEEQGKKLAEIRKKRDPEGRICGYLDVGDKSGVVGLENVHEWQATAERG